MSKTSIDQASYFVCACGQDSAGCIGSPGPKDFEPDDFTGSHPVNISCFAAGVASSTLADVAAHAAKFQATALGSLPDLNPMTSLVEAMEKVETTAANIVSRSVVQIALSAADLAFLAKMRSLADRSLVQLQPSLRIGEALSSMPVPAELLANMARTRESLLAPFKRLEEQQADADFHFLKSRGPTPLPVVPRRPIADPNQSLVRRSSPKPATPSESRNPIGFGAFLNGEIEFRRPMYWRVRKPIGFGAFLDGSF